MIKRVIEGMKNIKVKATTFSFAGISLELGIQQKKVLAPEHLRELYKIHNALSHFYHLYYHKAILVEDIDDLILSINDEAINTYKMLADELLGSEYFILLNSEQRTKIRESFDYVNHWDAYLNASKENRVEAEDIEPYIEGLLVFFEETTKVIEDLEKQIDKK